MTHPVTSLLICLSVTSLIPITAGLLGEPCSTEPLLLCEDPETTCDENVCRCAQPLVNVSNVCTDVNCGALPRPQDGHVAFTLNDATSQYEAEYSCRRGYSLQGEELRICEAGQWTGAAPVCNIIECPSLASPTDGSLTISGGIGTEGQRAVDAVATYQCSNGYFLDGAQTRTCLETGLWTGNPPTCKPNPCPVHSLLPDSNIAGVVYNPNPPVYPGTVTFTCIQGYQLTGLASLECTAEGNWNGNIPTCDLIDSAATTTTTEAATTTTTPVLTCDLVCQNGGSCFINANSASECDCPNGFSGTICDVEDFCVTQPCPVEADCQLINAGRQCICPVGFKGANCAEFDPVVTCTNFEKTLYLDNSPSDADRSVCLPQGGTVEGDVCHNPGEGVTYQMEGYQYITSTVDDQNRFCVKYTGDSPTQSSTCVTVTAFEADDIVLRPWINDTADICFLFNNPPSINQPSPITLGFSPTVISGVVPLAVSDPDSHQSLTVSILDVIPANLASNFVIDNFNLQVTKPVPFDTSQSVLVTLSVTDSGIPSLSHSSQVTVDLVPVSDLACVVDPAPPLLFHIPAGLPNTLVDLGQVTCPNVASDAGLTFDATTVVGPVGVDANNGTIYYSPDLQDTSSGDGNFDLTVTARVQQPVALSQEIVVPIIADDFRPDCGQPQALTFIESADIPDCSDFFVCSERANVSETCEDDSLLFDVACERDTGSWHTNVKLCVTGSLLNQFGDYQVPVRVINSYGTTSLSVPVTVQNVNNPPQIIAGDQLSTSVPEKEDIGYQMASLSVSDPDLLEPSSTEVLTVTLTDAVSDLADVPFSAVINTDFTTVFILTTEVLDVSVRNFYQLRLTVRDSAGLSDTVVINVTVGNVNEAPTCADTIITADVSVRQSVGATVTVVQCSDPDAGDTLSYSLQGSDLFAIDSSTGTVTVASSLAGLASVDRLTLQVTVTDQGGLTVSVQIDLTINNQFPPVCNGQPYSKSLSENTEANICFDVDVNCVDDVASEQISYVLVSGNATQVFRNSTDSPSLGSLQLCTKVALKNLYGIYMANIKASSSYGETQFSVSLNVNDVNDPPSFAQNLYTVTIPEDRTVGYQVLTVSATDPDSGAAGIVQYESKDISDSAFFDLDPNTGTLLVVGQLDVDLGNQPDTYTFLVEALDSTPSPQKSSVNVEITVTDVNDNPPVCTPPPATVSLALTDLVGTLITTLSCSDADKSDAFRQTGFRLTDTSSPGFAVNSTGEVYLSAPLSRDATSYTIDVEAYDLDKPNLNYQATITININNAIPPVCTPPFINGTLRETKPVMDCPYNEVICSDPTGGTVTIVSETGTGTQYMETRRNPGNSQLGLNACIKKDIKDQFGNYELQVEVTNGLASTTVTWTFEVVNVNEAPSFSQSLFEATVDEGLDTNRRILDIIVSDPDEYFNVPDFKISSVTALLANNADFENRLNNTLLFAERGFYAVRTMNATTRNLYRYNLRVQDGKGLYGVAEAIINVRDINSAPICPDPHPEATLTILADVGAEVYKVFCFDTDNDPQNKELSFRITGGDRDNYFNVTNDGSVRVAKKFPRTSLYGRAAANLTVEVRDNGTPSYVTNVYLNVLVNNQITSQCNPVLTPPDIWVIDKCATLTMDCTDPTIPGQTDHLAYTPSGNYTGQFRLTAQDGVFSLCYRLTRDSTSQVIILVENGLQGKFYTEIIRVQYSATPPVFTSAEYTKEVTENFAANSVVLTVEAASANLTGSLVYKVIGDSSTPGWDSYFQLDKTSGQVTSLVQLQELANQVVRLRVEVEDTGSQLRSETQVQITVVDINEAPTCTTTPDLALDVTATVGTQVVAFSCSDPDKKLEYKTFTYQLSGDGVPGVFALTPGDNPVSITTRAELSVTEPSYTIQMSVTDGGSPSLVFSETFTVDVSLLPPPLVVEVTEHTYESILVRWRYERAAFHTVTQSYKVVLTPPQGAVIESEFQGAEIRQFNMTELQADTDYSLVVQAITTYGTQESVPLSATTPVVPILSTFVCTIRVKSENFNLRHRDTGSQMYFSLEQKVVQSFDSFLGNGNTLGYVRSEVQGFRPDNSVFVDMIVYVDQFGNVTVTIEALRNRVNSGWLDGGLSVDSVYFFAFEGDGYIMIESIGYSPRPALNGTDATVTCNVLTVGYPRNAVFDFWWTYNGNVLQPTSRSRYTISHTTDADIFENKQTTLDVSPILTEHAGVYGCMVSDEGGLQTVSSDIAVSVRGQPVVTLTPRSQTVNSGDPVILVCALLDNENTFTQFVWYKNGVLLQDAPGLDITPGNNNETLTITNIQTSAVYGCQGTGQAGAGARVESHVGVIPTGAAGDIVCGITTEVRNSYVVRWPTTAPDTVAINECKHEFIGEVTRSCDVRGQWRPSVFDCRKLSLQQIGDQVQAIQDGTSTSDLSSAIDQLADETDRPLFDGDLDLVLATLNDIVAIVTNPADSPDVSPAKAEEDTENYLRIASNLISADNKPTWESRLAHNREGAIAVPQGVEGYLRGRINHLSPGDDYYKTFTEDHVYAEVGKGDRSSYNFPDRSQAGTPAWLKDSSTRISIPTQAMQGHSSLGYGSSFYKNIPDILDTKFMINGEIEDKVRHINADTVTFQVMGDIGVVDPPARIFFQHFLTNYSDPKCVSWDSNKNAYVTDGCYMVSTSDEMTECACNHFTNFAILMSPGKTPAADLKALSIISAVGCALSIFFLLLTILCYLMVWRYVKSDRAVLLINLCVALIIAYIVFLAGVGRAENEDVCTAVSLLLHFFYLAVFFLMLAYGIEIGVTIIYVFATSSRIKWLLPLAWGIPLVIVVISAGVTQLDGYGNDNFCWLSLEDGLLWAFVGPAAFVILFNFIIVIAVFRKMFKSSAMLTKTDRERAKTGIRSLCVLLPILGLTWVFGVFSVNEDLVVFQYIFAVCNSLQGVFIFLFHCAFNKQLKDAFKQRKARKKSVQSFDKSFNKNQHSSTSSSGLYSDSSKPNNDSGFVTESTNPFLEADRQMKEMYEKNKTGAATYDNNKLRATGKDGAAVDLEDVKISNILRESEVMGGTAGISSILQTQSSSLPDTTRVTDDEKGVGLRQSAVSSHKYDYIDTSNVSKPSAASQKYDYVDAASRSEPAYTENAVYVRTETETPKTSGYEPPHQPYSQKITVSNDSLGASKDSKKGRGQENLTDRQKGKIYGSPEKVRKDGSAKSKEGSGSGATKSQLSKSSKSSRSDEDYEVRVMEPYHSKTHVYMPYGRGPSSSAQNISSISTALPTITYDQYQAKTKGKVDSPRKADSSLKKKEKPKKKPAGKDRSKAYEYSFESTYLGDRSRHASLENMNSQNYSPYSQMPGMGGYTTGRPTHQQQQWDQYRCNEEYALPAYSSLHRHQAHHPQHPQHPAQHQQSRQPYYRGDYW